MNIATEFHLIRELMPMADQPLSITLDRKPISIHILNDEDAFVLTSFALEEFYITTELDASTDWSWENDTLQISAAIEPDTTIVAVFSTFNDGRPYFCSECRTPAPVGCDHNPSY